MYFFKKMIPLFVAGIIISCNNENKPLYDEITCNVETISKDSNYLTTAPILYNIFFTGGNLMTSKSAHSGLYSIIVDKTYPFSLEYHVKEANNGQHYYVSTWRYKSKKASLVATCEESSKFWLGQTQTSKIDENGWDLLELDFRIPPGINPKFLNVYVWDPDTVQEAYFDDLTIRYYYD